jgi:hypothetical protein
MRQVACCHAEPECVLCPLRPENEGRSLAELAAAGLKANLAGAELAAAGLKANAPAADDGDGGKSRGPT